MIAKIWSNIKWIGGLIITLGVLLLIAYQLWGKNKRQGEITNKIDELKKIENKTEADKQELERLEKEAENAKKEIDDINKKYEEKIKDLGKKENEPPKPGDAAQASDNLNNVW